MSAESAALKTYHVGVDVGSTTTKFVVIDTVSHECVYSVYERHHAHQIESMKPLLADIGEKFAGAHLRMAMSGSGGKAIADVLGVPYIQEVVANSIAVQALHPNARCAVELGGQDAKMIFFEQDPRTGRLQVADMRMNGSCAGGTGAFIDEIATLLKTPVEEINALAEAGQTVYNISGRCGVYAKTDIQPLLNQGALKEDIALSTFHAIAKQTLGGLAQGLDINPPVIFEGGPLTFNPRLISVFAERLNLSDDNIIIPDKPETIVAQGAAYALEGMFADVDATIDVPTLLAALEAAPAALEGEAQRGVPFFATEEEHAAFTKRHELAPAPAFDYEPGSRVCAYLGIDSGSTTTKFVLLDEDENLIDEFYSSNEGEPLDIAKEALVKMADKYAQAGVELNIIACGTTGYGETLFANAFHADTHVVETVAHSVAAANYVPDVSFILDIGGQDMKAIWVNDGIVTDILVNEACSSGCGSFLESFGKSLGIATREIAPAAFRSTNPAVLGSRCTVFMNSSVVTEQKNGKSPDDIMAGLCRSIIENVFTKVIRVSNVASLGSKIVVQGGTFMNDAVLAAFEQYVNKQVTRAPYPGLMGAIGAALLTKRKVEETIAETGCYQSSFIGLDAVRDFTYEQDSNVVCPFCGNACSRTIVRFADGSVSVTGNRCERGEIAGDPKDASVREAVRAVTAKKDSVPNLFPLRQKLLFADYDCEVLLPAQNVIIGLPRVLALWDTAPFWTTFLRALGFDVKLSRLSTHRMYEKGLHAVTSDTVCFPAKLVHGHIRDLVDAKVDRIFMPIVTTVASENTEKTSESMCAVVKGFPMVIRNSDNPEERFGIPFDDPLFHWYSDKDRERQLTEYMEKTFGITPRITARAIEFADEAMRSFRAQLVDAGAKVLEDVRRAGRYAVVLGSRPYHNDPLVNHDLPEMFTAQGIPVLTPDAVPGINEVDLSHSRIDIVNNFHARMLSGAIIAASSDYLEFAQIVSFGCGHDAYLSDEIIRMMKEVGGKTPLVLKVDESDVPGPLRIRVRSFVETVNMRYKAEAAARAEGKTLREVKGLEDPYPQKFTKSDRKRRVVLVPNTSHAFSRLMAVAFARQGLETVALPIGREEAIRLGKKYVHNDICFPAQIVIGEALAELESGKYDGCEVAVGTGKYVGDCRLTHYAALLRRALDDAGYADVPIITNDDVDYHDMQPGFKMNTASAITISIALPMIDVLEELLRKMRPYELVPGAANEAFERALDALIAGIERAGSRGARAGFKQAIDIMKTVEYDRSNPRPTVLIVGEYLLNFHPGANHDIEQYLEDNGFEIIEARMTDVIRKTYFYKDAQVREYHVDKPIGEKAWYRIANGLFDHAHNVTDAIAVAHPLYEPVARMDEIVKDSDPIIHHTFDAGEGVLIPAEIIHHAQHGCEAFVILQPFGCLPNHVVGRGIARRLKEMFPHAQILPLDYDPDVSFANLENRLQMLVMNAREKQVQAAQAEIKADLRSVDDMLASLLESIDAHSGSLSVELATCAESICKIADEIRVLADEVDADLAMSENQTSDWLKNRGLDDVKRVQDIAAKTSALTQCAAAISERAAQGDQKQQEPQGLEAIAEKARDLADQINKEAQRAAEGAAATLDQARANFASSQGAANELGEQLAKDARVQLQRVAESAGELRDRAAELIEQITKPNK